MTTDAAAPRVRARAGSRPAERGRLTVEDLVLRFAGVTALDGVSFSVEPGERVALVGPNGAGKTSVLNCVSGVERPSSGRIAVGGRDLAGVRPCRRPSLGVARTLQGLAVVDGLDVLGNLLLGRHHLGRAGVVASALRLRRARLEEARDRRKCREVAEELGLDADLASAARDLPAGARKRLELGRALAMGPALLLLDEPFAGAGPGDLELMTAAIRRAGESGAAVVVVDHDLGTVLGRGRAGVGAAAPPLVHRAVVLDAGRVVAVGTPADVQQHPSVLEVYLGATG